MPDAPEPLTPADLFRTLSIMCGIGTEVAELLSRRVLLPGLPLAEVLIRRRQALGLSLRETSARCGLAHTQVVHYEKHRGVPGIATIIKLARGYELPVSLILVASLNSANLLTTSAPGAKPIPRNRTRVRKT